MPCVALPAQVIPEAPRAAPVPETKTLGHEREYVVTCGPRRYRVRAKKPPVPLEGASRRALKHNAEKLCALGSRRVSGCRPHNGRYVQVPAQQRASRVSCLIEAFSRFSNRSRQQQTAHAEGCGCAAVFLSPRLLCVPCSPRGTPPRRPMWSSFKSKAPSAAAAAATGFGGSGTAGGSRAAACHVVQRRPPDPTPERPVVEFACHALPAQSLIVAPRSEASGAAPLGQRCRSHSLPMGTPPTPTCAEFRERALLGSHSTMQVDPAA